jgi:putative FmdB family regulatory protein
MPIYEYQCRHCQKQFELIVSLTGNEPVDCPDCGSTDVKKLLSAVSVGAGSSSPAPLPTAGGCSPRGGFS